MKTNTDGLPGLVAPILTADLLSRTYDLNADYLHLLIAEHTNPSLGGLRSLPDRVLDELAHASRDALRALATTPFALYSLGFEDQEFWRAALRMPPEPIEARYGVLSSAVMQSSFCEIALVHAWHVAVTQPIAARMIYGMPISVVDCIARAHLWQLRRVAVDYPNLVMPRWPSNPCFWPDMLKYAAASDLRRLATMQQLGHQLIAAELQASHARHSASRERQRNLLKQRLHKRRG